MQIPPDQRFYLQSAEHLVRELARLDLPYRLEVEGQSLCRSFRLRNGRGILPNRFCARAMPGGDARSDGSPSERTTRRYQGLSRGGYGTVFTEPVFLDSTGDQWNGALRLNASLLRAYAEWLKMIRPTAVHPAVQPLFFLQVADLCVATQSDAVRVEAYQGAARFAKDAGFDGIEICCQGGGFEQELAAAASRWAEEPTVAWNPRSQALLRICCQVQESVPDLLLSVRFCAYVAQQAPPGFGAVPADYRQFEPTLPTALVAALAESGVSLVNAVVTHPALRAQVESVNTPLAEEAFPHEHPLTAIGRSLEIGAALRAAAPDLAVVLGGMTWLRHYLPAFAAGCIADGMLDCVAMERFALAYPDAPAEWLAKGRLDPYRCCTQCGACAWLRDAGGRVGCVLMDPDVYGAEYRLQQRYSSAHLLAEAQRCRQCDLAPCVRATPGQLDIPRFMRLYGRGGIERAGLLLRESQPLAEMCALLAPYGASGERACVETTFSGNAIPIRDLQYSAAVQTRDRAGVRMPGRETGRHVVVVGAGPAGLAATVELLKRGHRVSLYERSSVAGGVPALLIPSTRYRGSQEEIQILLAPARANGRLKETFGVAVGEDISLASLQSASDAVLLTIGLWQDSLVCGMLPAAGAYGALTFLERVKQNGLKVRGRCAALLAGGDCAMDAAVVLREQGVETLYILFAGARSDMHWCMQEDWFAQPGIHLLTLSQPNGYVLDAAGKICGIRIQPMTPDGLDRVGGGTVLNVDLIVDASGLDAAKAPLHELSPPLERSGGDRFGTNHPGLFVAGALVNGGGSIPQCVHEGSRAACEIDCWLKGKEQG